MKYLLVLSWLELGGAERQAINFAEYLQDHGHEVTVLGLGAPGRVNEICGSHDIRCISLEPRNDLYAIRYKILHRLRIRRLTDEEIALTGLIHDLSCHIKAEGYDVAISYCALANTVLGCAGPDCGRTVCIWYQRDAGVYDRTDGLQVRAAGSADIMLANGIACVEWLRRAYGREARLVYNGVKAQPARKSRDEWRSELGVTDNDMVCTMVAQLNHDRKDHMTLLKIWKELIHRDGRFRLVLAGRFDNAYTELKEYAEAEGLTDHVRFLGHTDDVFGLLYSTDICVFSTKTEGSPNGVLEGCLCGLPFVATDIPEVREALSEDNCQYLFHADETDRAVDLILKLSANPGLRESLGEANRRKAADMFDPEKNFDEIISISEELVRTDGIGTP